MTQDEFDKAPLLDQILYDTTGMLVENYPSIGEAMDNYHQAKLKLLSIADVRQRIIAYTNWLSKQNLMICEGVDGHTFRSSMIGGKKYTAEELYDKFVSEYVA